jgi:hypothetical protein
MERFFSLYMRCMNTPRRSLGSIVAPILVGATSAVATVGLYDVAGQHDRRGDQRDGRMSEIDSTMLDGRVDERYAKMAIASIGAMVGLISTATFQTLQRIENGDYSQ